MRREAGFTLIELLVSAAIMGIVVVGITSAFTTQHRTYVVVDQVTEAQQNLRAVSDLIERDVRRAGYMVKAHGAVCGYDRTDAADTLFVSDADAVRSIFDLEDLVDEGEPDILSASFGATVSGAGPTYTISAGAGGTGVTLDQLFLDVAADGVDFQVNAGLILYDRLRPDGLVACGVVTAVAGNTLTVNFGDTSFTTGSNPDVVAIPAHVYQLVPAAGGAPSRLLRDGQLLAVGVEDFQVSYFFDEDDDLVIDAGELFGTSGGTDRPWELTPATSRPDHSTLREVGVNLVTATRDDDPNDAYQLGTGQSIGNRTTASLPGVDRKRRRVYSARVRIRNNAV